MKEKASSATVLAAIGFAAAGLFSFGLVCVALLLRPDTLAGDPARGAVQALTHLATLGWIGSLLFAGAYLAGPVIAGSRLWSGRLPMFHLICHLTGLGLLLGGLVLQRPEATAAGAWVVFVGLLAMVYNLFRTGSRRSLWTPANMAFQAAMFWLAVTAGVALYLLRARGLEAPPVTPEVLGALHAHFALFGFLAQVLLGVSLRVVPELLGEVKPHAGPRGMAWSGWVLLNGGLFLLFPVALSGSDRAVFFTGLVVALGIAAFAAAIAGVLWRSRTHITWGTATHATGVLLLVLIAAGALATFPQIHDGAVEDLSAWMRIYISLALLGPFAFASFGAGERLAPRLIWRLRYEPWKDFGALPPVSSLARGAAAGPVFFALLMAWIYLFIGQVWQDPESIRLAAVLLLVALGWFLAVLSPGLLRFILGVTPADLGGFSHPTKEPANS